MSFVRALPARLPPEPGRPAEASRPAAPMLPAAAPASSVLRRKTVQQQRELDLRR